VGYSPTGPTGFTFWLRKRKIVVFACAHVAILSSSPEQGLSRTPTVETSKLIVSQPPKLKELQELLGTLDAYESRISERVGEDRSDDLGGAGAGVGARRDDGTYISPRDLAIQNLPLPEIMQRELGKHIRKEVKRLNREARKIVRLRRPGAAYYLNELYAKIRRLNALLHELLEASYEIVKRLFIRVFIDRQPIL